MHEWSNFLSKWHYFFGRKVTIILDYVKKVVFLPYEAVIFHFRGHFVYTKKQSQKINFHEFRNSMRTAPFRLSWERDTSGIVISERHLPSRPPSLPPPPNTAVRRRFHRRPPAGLPRSVFQLVCQVLSLSLSLRLAISRRLSRSDQVTG